MITAVLFVAMLATFEVGRRMGAARLAKDPDGLAKGVGAAEGAVFALLGLLMAFTFSGAASRFEGRRLLIDTEANAIGTAWLRIDLLPAETQPPIREMFKRYATSARHGLPRRDRRCAKSRRGLAAGTPLQNDIWKAAVAAMPAARCFAAGHHAAAAGAQRDDRHRLDSPGWQTTESPAAW